MKKEIHISNELYQELEVALKKRSEMESVDVFAEQLLRDALSSEYGAVYKKHDEEEIRQRLKDLGYID